MPSKLRTKQARSDSSEQIYTPDAQFDRNKRQNSGLDTKLPVRADLLDGSDSVDPVVQIILQYQYEDFGFPLYRVNYDDEEKWARWYEAFNKLLDSSLEEASGGKAIMDRLVTYKVEDSELNHMSFQAVQELVSSASELLRD
jgi:hypothetical protein